VGTRKKCINILEYNGANISIKKTLKSLRMLHRLAHLAENKI
jgi:hypothetical protein